MTHRWPRGGALPSSAARERFVRLLFWHGHPHWTRVRQASHVTVAFTPNGSSLSPHDCLSIPTRQFAWRCASRRYARRRPPCCLEVAGRHASSKPPPPFPRRRAPCVVGVPPRGALPCARRTGRPPSSACVEVGCRVGLGGVRASVQTACRQCGIESGTFVWRDSWGRLASVCVSGMGPNT